VNGLYDMGANVWEWTTDSHDNTGRERRTVGGSWWYGAFNMKADVQAFKQADFYAVYIGFRCVYDR
jgi:formylglycine-generating enzyme required for sulfatase activity